MKALLLAAGLGTRLKPVTDHTPKCLVPIHGKPLLAYWLDLVLSNGVDEVLINTHYLSQQVADFINASPWASRVTLAHEEALLGTGGTIFKNRAFIGNESFLLAHADNLTRFNVRHFISTHQARKPGIDITMMTFDTDVPESCGIVRTDEDGRVIKFFEKIWGFYGTRANAAVYIMESSVIDYLASLDKAFIDISTEVLPAYLGKMQVWHNAEYHRDIGTPVSLALAEVEYSL